MTLAEVFARDFARAVEGDVRPETVTWDVDSTFLCIVTAIDNTISFEQGGAIQEYVCEISVPFYLNDANNQLVPQFPDGIPGEGTIIQLRGMPRRVFAIQQSPDNAGWIFKLEGPDK